MVSLFELPSDIIACELAPKLASLERLALGLTCRAALRMFVDVPVCNGAVLVCQQGAEELRRLFVHSRAALTACRYWIEAPTLDVYLWYAERDGSRWSEANVERLVPHVLVRAGRTSLLDHYLGHHIWGRPPRGWVQKVGWKFSYEVIRAAILYRRHKILLLPRLSVAFRNLPAELRTLYQQAFQ
jgi:hypothetical protein